MLFDALVTNPGRLRILAALASEPVQPFVRLRRATGLTDGNLATHARRLQSAGLVSIEKSITDDKPLTTLQLTDEGREALATHVRSLMAALTPAACTESVVADAGDPPETLAHSAADDWVD